jgi:hypothetical protein
MSKNHEMTPEERQKYIDWGLDPDGPPGDWTGYIPELNDMDVNHIVNDGLAAPMIDPEKSALMDTATRPRCPAPGVRIADLLNEAWTQTKEEGQTADEKASARSGTLDASKAKAQPEIGTASVREKSQKNQKDRRATEAEARPAAAPTKARPRFRTTDRDDGRER